MSIQIWMGIEIILKFLGTGSGNWLIGIEGNGRSFPCDYSLTNATRSSHVWPVLYSFIVVCRFPYEFSTYISATVNLLLIVVVIIISSLLVLMYCTK